jgi:hypothetical protein
MGREKRGGEEEERRVARDRDRMRVDHLPSVAPFQQTLSNGNGTQDRREEDRTEEVR